jgi:hypothetical protein
MANTLKTPAGPGEKSRYLPPIADSKKLCDDLMSVLEAEMDLRNIPLEDAYEALKDLTPYDFMDCDHVLVSRLVEHFRAHADQELIFFEAFAQLKCDLMHKVDKAKPNSIAETVAETLRKFIHSPKKPS